MLFFVLDMEFHVNFKKFIPITKSFHLLLNKVPTDVRKGTN